MPHPEGFSVHLTGLNTIWAVYWRNQDLGQCSRSGGGIVGVSRPSDISSEDSDTGACLAKPRK